MSVLQGGDEDGLDGVQAVLGLVEDAGELTERLTGVDVRPAARRNALGQRAEGQRQRERERAEGDDNERDEGDRRLTGRGAEHLVLDHYLEALLTKPGALERSEALHQARAEGTFTAVHEAFWAAAKKALGDTEGTKSLVKVLLLHRHQQHADVVTGIRAALAAGTFNEDVIALEARKAAQAAGPAPTVTAASAPAPELLDPGPAQVTPLTSRRLARALPSDQRPLPRLEQWDELLQLRRKDSSS